MYTYPFGCIDTEFVSTRMHKPNCCSRLCWQKKGQAAWTAAAPGKHSEVDDLSLQQGNSHQAVSSRRLSLFPKPQTWRSLPDPLLATMGLLRVSWFSCTLDRFILFCTLHSKPSTQNPTHTSEILDPWFTGQAFTSLMRLLAGSIRVTRSSPLVAQRISSFLSGTGLSYNRGRLRSRAGLLDLTLEPWPSQEPESSLWFAALVTIASTASSP